MELERIIVALSGQAQALADAGGADGGRVGGLKRTTRSSQEAIQSPDRRQRTGVRAPADHHGSNSLVRKYVVPEGLANKTGFEQRGHRCKFVAQAEGERFNTFLAWSDTGETSAPTIVPESGGVVEAQSFAQHVYASLLMRTETGTDARSMVGSTLGENGPDMEATRAALRPSFGAGRPQFHEQDREASRRQDREQIGPT